jgi:hypothetical protein
MQCSSAISGALIGNSSWRDTELEEKHDTMLEVNKYVEKYILF